ncbi:hypothetical protein DPEC_G00257390 [Dallia pectoralis]|uniref:Uncharacterized protein n=1 Tax=Dallia pectoralis TaxID=75939 RepID=A0ACC2FQQ4_DALPE|nr:hypothetical protein DPEC_G00257390 [Dallia pectoralis]
MEMADLQYSKFPVLFQVGFEAASGLLEGSARVDAVPLQGQPCRHISSIRLPESVTMGVAATPAGARGQQTPHPQSVSPPFSWESSCSRSGDRDCSWSQA